MRRSNRRAKEIDGGACESDRGARGTSEEARRHGGDECREGTSTGDADDRYNRRKREHVSPPRTIKQSPEKSDLKDYRRAQKCIKPDKFAATTPLEAYLSHFETISEYNGWS